VVAGLPVTAMLCLPIMFAAGMSTVDTIDGIMMAHAYDWALRRPVRKIFYNLTITTLSVLVALLVGTVQLMHVASLTLWRMLRIEERWAPVALAGAPPGDGDGM
jgi:nickel/cobalt transporter (NiCoT) family protein